MPRELPLEEGLCGRRFGHGILELFILYTCSGRRLGPNPEVALSGHPHPVSNIAILALRPYAHAAGNGLVQGVCRKSAYAACSALTRLIGLHAARLLAAACGVCPRAAQMCRHELAHPLPEEIDLLGVCPRVARVDVLAPGVAEVELLVGSGVVRVGSRLYYAVH